MSSPEGDELRREQSELRLLSDDIREFLDKPVGIAADQNWKGPNAENVRGELRLYKGKLQTMASSLDAEAGRRGRDAETADKKPR